MEYAWLWLGLAAFGAFTMAFANGANDVANSFASAVGAKAVTIKQATLIAGLANFLGATLLGGIVSAKLITGLIDPERFETPMTYVAAMFAVLLASASFVLLATYTKMPVSSSHSIVGSLIGVSAFVGGWGTVRWDELTKIVVSWFISPLLAGAMAYLLLTLIRRLIVRDGAKGLPSRLQFYLPYILAAATCVFALILMKKSSLSAFRPTDTLGYVVFVGVLAPYATLVAQGVLRATTQKLEDNREAVEGVFRRLQIGTSSYVAFAHGANDVANSIAPVLGVYLVMQSGALPTEALVEQTGVPLWVLVLGGVGIAAGIGLFGNRVIETLSERVTTLNNTPGFSVDFSAATTVVIASLMGIPVSSTHSATGAIVGSGLSDREPVRWGVFGKIVIAWIVTVPTAAAIAVGYFMLLRRLLGV